MLEINVYQRFFDSLQRIINDDGPYRQKLSALMTEANEQDKSNLEELYSWLSEVEF